MKNAFLSSSSARDHVVAGLGPKELVVVDQGGLDVELLGHDDRLDRRLDLGLLVVGLVDHVRDLGALRRVRGERWISWKIRKTW